MNIQISAAEYKTGAEVIAAAKARRGSIMNPPVVVERMKKMRSELAEERAKLDQANQSLEMALKEIGELKTRNEQLRMVLKELEPGIVSRRKPHAIALEILRTRYPRITLLEILGDCRMKHLIKPRHEIWAECHKERPDISITQLARLFCRDHTTFLAAFRKMNLPVDCGKDGQ